MLLLLTLLPFAMASSPCPADPELRDSDGDLTVLTQNLKFIATGSHRAARAELLRAYLQGDGGAVDLLLLQEARITGTLGSLAPDWCLYGQGGDGRSGYAWHPVAAVRSPGGLVLGVRRSEHGRPRRIASGGGKRFRARAVTLAEGLLGPVFAYRKGWATLTVDDTRIVWSHTQASYRRRPERGAGAPGQGRAGQFDDLATDLGRPAEATLITGDLNLLAGFRPHCKANEAGVCRARDIDDSTIARFRTQTGLDLSWFASVSTFAGSLFKGRGASLWDAEAAYDRVGVNDAFLERHPGAHVTTVEIGDERMRVSDHLGLRITIPFGPDGSR